MLALHREHQLWALTELADSDPVCNFSIDGSDLALGRGARTSENSLVAIGPGRISTPPLPSPTLANTTLTGKWVHTGEPVLFLSLFQTMVEQSSTEITGHHG